jgi:hypothetical protein
MPKAEKEESKLLWGYGPARFIRGSAPTCKLGSVVQFRKFPKSSKIFNSFVLKNHSTNTKGFNVVLVLLFLKV